MRSGQGHERQGKKNEGGEGRHFTWGGREEAEAKGEPIRDGTKGKRKDLGKQWLNTTIIISGATSGFRPAAPLVYGIESDAFVKLSQPPVQGQR
jgi:hypothetical protein